MTDGVLDEPFDQLDVDLIVLTFLDSTGLGSLIKAKSLADERGIKMEFTRGESGSSSGTGPHGHVGRFDLI